ncbi:LacI family DNA-binding transcriptional regulator [Peribacillus loiseleuriae]|uniref:LacI family DNA-binding transcriptional regulator n=1 Tax=Peribacillus loiseleuriae TaxID=1679170 RepID=UPI0009E1CAB4|nr:LacI family DNA-binding transcriptional regulator [Peribacillus loiseleuriae]
MTIKDISKKAEVSVATVSYVINNTRYVSPEKEERVKHVSNPFYADLAKACEVVAHN